jgi:tetratricopeptide (TPR) repeat protein
MSKLTKKEWDNYKRSSGVQLSINEWEYMKEMHGKSEALHRIGKKEEAIKCYDEILKRIPNDQFALRGKENCLNNLGNYKEASIYTEKILATCPNHDWGYLLRRADSLQDKGKLDEALKFYNRIVVLIPQNPLMWERKYRLESRINEKNNLKEKKIIEEKPQENNLEEKVKEIRIPTSIKTIGGGVIGSIGGAGIGMAATFGIGVLAMPFVFWDAIAEENTTAWLNNSFLETLTYGGAVIGGLYGATMGYLSNKKIQ